MELIIYKIYFLIFEYFYLKDLNIKKNEIIIKVGTWSLIFINKIFISSISQQWAVTTQKDNNNLNISKPKYFLWAIKYLLASFFDNFIIIFELFIII